MSTPLLVLILQLLLYFLVNDITSFLDAMQLVVYFVLFVFGGKIKKSTHGTCNC